MTTNQWKFTALALGAVAVYALIQPTPPAPVYVATAQPEPAPVYVPPPAPEPEPAVYTLPVQFLKAEPHPSRNVPGVNADIRVTNNSPLPIKFLMLQMEYTDHAGNYLGVADVAFHGIPVGQSSIGKASIRGTSMDQLGGYTLRLDTVTGEGGFLTQHFAIAENRQQ